MTDRYAVWGHPIAHSQSPWIHTRFARSLGQDLSYEALLGDLDRFEEQVLSAFDQGYKGFNITLPFKFRALTLATQRSMSAELAQAANTLKRDDSGTIEAHNTDGLGLSRDLARCAITLVDTPVLILGAGGATSGILEPLLKAGAQIQLANRTPERAEEMASRFNRADLGAPIEVVPFERLTGLRPRLVINATSTGLSGETLPIPEELWRDVEWVYDLAYSPSGQTSFNHLARSYGVAHSFDGLGMLVEQAAESFCLWRGVRPETESVLTELRTYLQQSGTHQA